MSVDGVGAVFSRCLGMAVVAGLVDDDVVVVVDEGERREATVAAFGKCVADAVQGGLEKIEAGDVAADFDLVGGAVVAAHQGHFVNVDGPERGGLVEVMAGSCNGAA